MQKEFLGINAALKNATNGKTDVLPWYSPYDNHDQDVCNEVLSGAWYKITVKKMVRDGQPDCVCPLILCIDKTFIDPFRSRFNLEPLNFTLSIFKQNVRTKVDLWRTLGYVTDHKHLTADQKTTISSKQGNESLVSQTITNSLLQFFTA